jgi:DNA-binding GntR family transcriptional regulator
MFMGNQAYGKIRSLIIKGELPVGEPLSERGLAERLSIGRMPVREAIKELAREGLLRSFQGRGTFIRQLTFVELRDIFETRQGLEGIAARLASLRGVTPELKQLGERMRALEEEPEFDIKEAKRVGKEFHCELMVASRNSQLIKIYDDLDAQIELSWRPHALYQPVRSRKSNSDHLAILDSVEKGEAERAENRMRTHLAEGLAARMEMLQAVTSG